jgi:hypothetical protein
VAFGLMGQRPALPMGPHGQADRPGPASPSVGRPKTPVRGAHARGRAVARLSRVRLWLRAKKVFTVATSVVRGWHRAR